MIFQRVNRDDPEKIFIVVKNSYGTASVTNGMAVQWDFLSAVDGVGVSIPTARSTNAGIATAGIIAETIAANDYGLCQVYGYHASVIFRAGTGTSLAGNLGSSVAINQAGAVWAVETYFTSTNSAAAFLQIYPCGFLMSIHSSWTTSRVKMFIKAL